MSSAVEQHVLDRIAQAPLTEDPFPYFYCENVFPEKAYQALFDQLPPDEVYGPLAGAETASDEDPYKRRSICDVNDVARRDGPDSAWGELWSWMSGPRFQQAIMSKFSRGIEERFGAGAKLWTRGDGRLVRDRTLYAIGPHTDVGKKLISLLFYMPTSEEDEEFGTSIYLPKDRNFRCDGSRHHPFKFFDRIATMPFKRNAVLGFLRNDRSFHGVEQITEIDVTRDVLLYNVYVDKVAQPAAATA